MKKRYTLIYPFIIFFLFTFSINGAAQIIATESFETPMVAGSNQGDCSCVTLPDQFSDGFNDYYGRQSDGTIAANGGTDYSGESGSFYLAGEDHDAGGDCTVCTGTLCMVMNDLTVPNPTEERVYEITFLAGGNNLNSDWETSDFLSIEYSIDDQVSWVPLKCFNYTLNGPVEVLSEDVDCNQPGDGVNILTSALTTYSAAFNVINPTNDQIHIRVCANSNSGNEEWAVDNIVLSDTGPTGPAPVALKSFDGSVDNDQVVLTWVTNSELDNEGFEVQRSLDGRQWEPIAWVNGNGTSQREQNYLFTDDHPAFGTTNYYRLKQIDFDGNFEYSVMISAYVEKQHRDFIIIYPNPSKNVVHYQLDPDADLQEIQVYNYLGRLLKTTRPNAGQLILEDLDPGTYLVVFRLQDRQISRRVIKAINH
ncbi:MAG: T9SS type A sorting domain-containing protein [Bacteroidota bacterium]